MGKSSGIAGAAPPRADGDWVTTAPTASAPAWTPGGSSAASREQIQPQREGASRSGARSMPGRHAVVPGRPTASGEATVPSTPQHRADALTARPQISEHNAAIRTFGSTTDPRQHHLEEYRYTLTVVSPLSESSGTQLKGRKRPPVSKKEAAAFRKIDGKAVVDLYNEPERLKEKLSVSLSYADQTKPNLFCAGSVGIIVGVPMPNVVAASPSNLATNYWNVYEINTERKNFKKSEYIDNPQKLLDETVDSNNAHNEILAIGTYKGSALSVDGFFYKIDAKGDPVSLKDMKVFSKHAKRLNLPLVPIPLRHDDPEFENDHSHTKLSRGLQYLGSKLFRKKINLSHLADIENNLAHGVQLHDSEEFMAPRKYLDERLKLFQANGDALLLEMHVQELWACFYDIKDNLTHEDFVHARKAFMSANQLDKSNMPSNATEAAIRNWPYLLREIDEKFDNLEKSFYGGRESVASEQM